MRRQPPQASTEQGFQACVEYYADKARDEWVGRLNQVLVIAHDDPDTVGIIRAHEQQEQTDKLHKYAAKFDPTSKDALPRGPGYQNFIRQNSKEVRNTMASSSCQQIPIETTMCPW